MIYETRVPVMGEDGNTIPAGTPVKTEVRDGRQVVLVTKDGRESFPMRARAASMKLREVSPR